MTGKTNVTWADKSLNPFSGCTQIATGCLNCYAKRLFPMAYGSRSFNDVQFHEERLQYLDHWKAPCRIFIGSMGDLFHKNITDDQINMVFQAMLRNDRHTYIILTKRPRRLWQWTAWMTQAYVHKAWPQHIQLGFSISTQQDAATMLPIFKHIPIETPIVSIEPAIEKINIRPWINNLSGVIHGCEKLAGNRPGRAFGIKWARDMRDQCIDAGVPYYLKQMAGNDGKVAELPELDGRVWDQLPGEVA